jgi:hypothetical protein
MPGRYGGPMKALPRDVDEIEKRNYQYIWRNVAQKMPLYTQTSGFAEPMMITHPDKRSYQYIWRNVAERMPPKTRKFTKMVDYNGEDFYTF